MIVTTFLVILMLDGMPHVKSEHTVAQECRTRAVELNAANANRPGRRAVCVAWTRKKYAERDSQA